MFSRNHDLSARLETLTPSEDPTNLPTLTPTEDPTNLPTLTPSEDPTNQPTPTPSEDPTDQPTDGPSSKPSQMPTQHPSNQYFCGNQPTNFFIHFGALVDTSFCLFLVTFRFGRRLKILHWIRRQLVLQRDRPTVLLVSPLGWNHDYPYVLCSEHEYYTEDLRSWLLSVFVCQLDQKIVFFSRRGRSSQNLLKPS